MLVGAGEEAHGPEGEGENHVGVGSEAHRPERAGGDLYMRVGARPKAHGPEGARGTLTSTWESDGRPQARVDRW